MGTYKIWINLIYSLNNLKYVVITNSTSKIYIKYLNHVFNF